jgi:hypothetical protein
VTRPKGPYPIIDEGLMLELLSGLKGPTKVQAGAFLSIMDGFDRHLPRTRFYEILSHSIWLHTWLGSMNTFDNVIRLWKDNKLTDDVVAGARAEFTAQTEAMRVYVAGVMQSVAQCPPSNAVIH